MRYLAGIPRAAALGATTLFSVALLMTTGAYAGEALDIQPFLMERDAEVLLARSAAPPAIGREATVQVLTARGFETVATGSNGFVCMVERSWSGPAAFSGDRGVFLNPRVKAPICYNAPAVETVLPRQALKTRLALEGASAETIRREVDRGLADGSLPVPPPSAMAYMLSAGQYLSDRAKKGMPHLMLYVPYATNDEWGGFVPGTPQAFVLYGEGSPEAVVIVPSSRFVELSEVGG